MNVEVETRGLPVLVGFAEVRGTPAVVSRVTTVVAIGFGGATTVVIVA